MRQEPLDSRAFGSVTTSLTNCDAEPIHIPGAIQPFGVLVAANHVTRRIVYASANAGSITGASVAAMLGTTLDDWLSASDYAGFFQGAWERDPEGRLSHNRTDSRRSCILTFPGGRRYHFTEKLFEELVQVEMEPETADPHGDRMVSNAQTVIDGVRGARTLAALLDITATRIRQFTGYDRVMVYRFDADGHGQVAAESCDPEMEPYLGLHYPATDIPPQARSLYMLQRVRAVADVHYTPVPMLGTSSVSLLDMTFCSLRSISPMHIEYLKNMGVGATLTLSLVIDGRLWGMIACHHRVAKLPSPALRGSCDLVSQIISFLIAHHIQYDEMHDHAYRRQCIEEIGTTLNGHDSVMDGLVAARDQILNLVGATGALLCFEGRRQCIGVTPGPAEAAQLMVMLRPLGSGNVFSTDNVAGVLPEAAPLRATASGVLMLSTRASTGEGILWFRPEYARTVKWGGNPDKSTEVDPETGWISPRKSFSEWRTKVELCSLPWRASDCEIVMSLQRVISTQFHILAERALSRSVLVDSLTSLPNRKDFEDKLSAWGEGKSVETAAVVLINLDRFKLVNEAFGHQAGDDLLQQAAMRMAKFARKGFFLARMGGDEFAALCTGMSPDDVDILAQEISDAIASPFSVFGKPFRITANVGVAHAEPSGHAELLRSADAALRRATRSGKTRAILLGSLLQRTAIQILELEQDLYRALDERQFALVYQPLVRLETRMVYGFEALVRWHHPVHGLIMPLDFIPLAEQTGLIVPIGAWVLHEAARMIRQWSQSYQRDLDIHVNVVSQQLTEPGFLRSIKELLVRTSVRPEQLSLEVTESVLLSELAVETLRSVRRSGIRISVDDFGTGYSSLAYLRKLPVDIVKIDRSFVMDIDSDVKSREFCAAILRLMRPLGLGTIAEGVETEEQRSALLAAECINAQGYLFSRPLDAEGVVALMEQCSRNGWTIPAADAAEDAAAAPAA